MALLQTVSPENAEGKVKEIYEEMMQRARVIPKPFQMMSASPELLAIVHQSIGHYFRHPGLRFELLAHIRMLVADYHNYAYCTDFNAGLLQMLTDATEEQLEAVKKDPAKAALDDKDRAMLVFVLKAVKTPDSVTQQDMDALHALGWTDRDILEAAHHGADMVRHGILFKTFKMDQ